MVFTTLHSLVQKSRDFAIMKILVPTIVKELELAEEIIVIVGRAMLGQIAHRKYESKINYKKSIILFISTSLSIKAITMAYSFSHPISHLNSRFV